MIELQQGIIKKNELLGVLKPVYEAIIIPFTQEQIEKEKKRRDNFYKNNKVSISCVPIFFPEMNKFENKWIVKIYCLNNESFNQVFDTKEEADKEYEIIRKIIFKVKK